MLELRGLDLGYNELTLVHNVSLHVNAGEIVALVGSNGAGKSTILRAVSGLLRPKRGQIVFDGAEITHRPPHEIAALGIAHVPEGKHLFTRMTVEENLTLGTFLNKDPDHRERMRKRVFALFPKLYDRRGQISGTLSGGEQQMLAIGRALMLGPRLLMLDEPSLGIAPKLVLDIFKAIKEINAEGLPILLLEQRLEQTLAVADRAYVLQTGKIAMQGTGAELLASDEVRKIYLGIN